MIALKDIQPWQQRVKAPQRKSKIRVVAGVTESKARDDYEAALHAYAEQLEREMDELRQDKQHLETYQLELLERAQILERERDALRRDNLELKRVYDERGKQIERLDTAIARAKSPQPVGAVVACEDYGRTIRWAGAMPEVGTQLFTALAAQTPAQQSGWQPIETAPKDATHILICRATDASGKPMGDAFGIFTQRAAWWDGEDGGNGAWIVYSNMIMEPTCFFKPTHWMPIPPAPADQQGEK